MFKTASRYWELINPVEIISLVIISTTLALFLSVLLLVLFRKKILIARSNAILKTIAISYFIIIPAISCVLGFKYGVVKGVHSTIQKKLPTYTKALDTLFIYELKEVLAQSKEKPLELSPDSGLYALISPTKRIDSLSAMVYNAYAKSLKTAANNKDHQVTASLAKLLLTSLDATHISNSIQKGIGKLLTTYLILNNDDAELREMDKVVKEILNGNFITKIINTHVDEFFNGIENKILSIVVIVFLLPLIEIIIANILYSKTRPDEQKSI